METGAVKQAYNNELILLKKNLNQAKIQTIHKLTRKAKQLTEKKAPDAAKEKLKRKAESAVKEVLIIKKIKPRDVGRFIVTHKGKLQDYLNKPQVDNDKACARLLLHKAMQEKYKSIKNRFSNVPIKDLFMSRQERLRLKKEEKEKKKEKQMKKLKKGLINLEGDWKVEDLHAEIKQKEKSKKVNKITKIKEDSGDDDDKDHVMSDESQSEHAYYDSCDNELEKNDANVSETVNTKSKKNGKTKLLKNNPQESSDHEEISDENDNDQEMSENDESEDDEHEEQLEPEENSDENQYQSGSDEETAGEGFKISFKGRSDESDNESCNEGSDDEEHFGKLLKSALSGKKSQSSCSETSIKNKEQKSITTKDTIPVPSKIEQARKPSKSLNKNKLEKKDSNKNKNLNEKILNKKFKKDSNDAAAKIENKVVDPFFITDSGDNYLTIVEPRAPDEVKEEHRRGNRKMRRAAMFGHVPKIKPRQDFKQDNNRFKRQNGFDRENFSNTLKDKDKFSNNKFNSRSHNKVNNDPKHKFNEEKPEKLHPSWEAKKKQSGILPFQGKKIVFDES